mmetsp:Transcript_22302/g.58109  ORF Transcript_22302/g.58109 Transcript_22302/m.58109 type:complete len:200 (+) Transcript_22302:503-1102(+)
MRAEQLRHADLPQQRQQLAQVQEVANVGKVTLDEVFDAEVQRRARLAQEGQVLLPCSRFHLLQLLEHFLHVVQQVQGGAVLAEEDAVCGGLHPAQRGVVLKGGAHCLERLNVLVLEQEQAWPGVEAAAVQGHGLQAAAHLRILLQHRHIKAASRSQPPGRGQPANATAHHHHPRRLAPLACRLHYRPPPASTPCAGSTR